MVLLVGLRQKKKENGLFPAQNDVSIIVLLLL
jgi:hypothetical protein